MVWYWTSALWRYYESFSDLSRENHSKPTSVRNLKIFPKNILRWNKEGKRPKKPELGKWSKKWFEWRTKVITEFMAKIREEVKAVNPKISFGTYTGAWYPSYYEVGVNFASREYDPSQKFDWATPQYKNYGYAELLDLYVTGNYYTDITIEEYKKSNNWVWNETDSQGTARYMVLCRRIVSTVRRILNGRPFMGGVLVDLFYDNPGETNLCHCRKSERCWWLDVYWYRSHIITKDLWKEVEAGMKEGGNLPTN